MIEGLFQPLHLLVILGIALFVFGPRRLPELGKGIGNGIRALKEGLREVSANSPAGPADAKGESAEPKS
jgi:sec-independent protein translocase protein TatA